MIAPWQESYDKPRQCVEKQRHYSAGKGPYSQGYGLPCGQVQLWELDHKGGRKTEKKKERECLSVFTSIEIQGGNSGKESAHQCSIYKRCRFDPWVRMISWSKKWQPIPVFLPGKSHGQRNQACYSPSGSKKSETTNCACADTHPYTHTHTHTHTHRNDLCHEKILHIIMKLLWALQWLKQ